MNTKRKFLDRLEGCPEWTRDHVNLDLAKDQKLTEEDIQMVIDLHNERLHLFHRLEKVDPDTPEGRAELREGVVTLEAIEYHLQDAWRFPQTSTHHTWWYKIPHCRCPLWDNRDSFGTENRVINRSCPAHGDS